MTCRATAALAYALVLTWAGGARAYSDPAQFSAPVLEAGGGGRFYTGSPAEGFGCDNCHAGGAAPRLEIAGLPARYVPRATYELRVSWSHEIEHAAAALELTDERGMGAGSLALPAQGTYLADESCDPKEEEILAAQLYAADGERTIAASPDCGAFMLRVQWTAPSRDVGPVWFAGSVLESNHEGDFAGDGVQSFARTIASFGETKPDVVTSGGCSVASGPAGGNALALLFLVCLSYASRKRFRLLIVLFGSTGCEVHESLWNQDTQISVKEGRAVAAWSDAQVLERPGDASADADAGTDAAMPVRDASVEDGAAMDGAALSDAGDLDDAGNEMADAMTPDAAPVDDSGQRCTFHVNTLSLGGRYTPRNVGAIWIERSDGTWVKTLERWAGVRLRYLTGFRAANPTGNKVDAVTSGTLSMFRAHNVGWNLADADGHEVADGDYRVQVEVTDVDKTGEMLTVPFKKTRPPFESKLADQDHFRDIQLRCR